MDWKRGFLIGAITGAVVIGGASRLFLWPDSERSRSPSADAIDALSPDAVMQALRADLDDGLRRWYSGDPFGYAELYAEELSYFDPGTDVALDGFDALRRYYEPLVDRFHLDRYETRNFRLQLHGELAILTFNLNEHEAGDAPTAEWKVTHVYRRLGVGWRIIHGHFSAAG